MDVSTRRRAPYHDWGYSHSRGLLATRMPRGLITIRAGTRVPHLTFLLGAMADGTFCDQDLRPTLLPLASSALHRAWLSVRAVPQLMGSLHQHGRLHVGIEASMVPLYGLHPFPIVVLAFSISWFSPSICGC
jgi:hypothetical protein